MPAIADIPGNAVPLSFARSVGIYGKSIVLDLGHRLLKRRKRTRVQVEADYDKGEWAQQSAAQSWSGAPTLRDFADKSWRKDPIVVQLDGRLWSLPANDYFALRRRRLTAVIAGHATDTDSLVELGSGTGTNLFNLALDDRWRELLGLELSATGRAVGRSVASHYGLEDCVHFDEIDLIDPTSSGFARIADKVVFTHYVLEQLPRHTETVFRNLVAAGIRRAIMIEPSFELLSPYSLRDVASMTYVWRQDYQRKIVRTARKLADEGVIRLLQVDRLHFASGWRNAPTLVVWEPTASGLKQR